MKIVGVTVWPALMENIQQQGTTLVLPVMFLAMDVMGMHMLVFTVL